MIEISLVLLLAAALLASGTVLRRVQAGAAALWLAGWTAAGTAGLLLLVADALPEARLLVHPLGALFPWLLLAGSYELDERPAPAWIVPVGVGAGLVRAALAESVSPQASYGFAALTEPPVAVAAAWLARRATHREGASITQRMLCPTMMVLAALGTLHVIWLALDRPVAPLLPAVWMLAAPLIVTEQIYAAAEKTRLTLQRARDALEERVAERTTQLARTNVSLRAEEEALRRSEERYRTVSELSSDFSFAFRIDPELRLEVEWMTGAFRRITGADPKELEGHGWLDFIREAERERVPERFAAPAEPDGQVIERAIRTRSGETRTLEIRVHAVRSEADGSLYVVGAARDVTEAHRAREERLELERRMQEAHRMESLGRLSGGVAHDFNNLLSVILGNSRLARAELDPDSPLHRRLDRIRVAAEHAARITDQMLAYAGRAQLAKEVFDLSRTVDGMRELVRASVAGGCRLEVEPSARALVEGDETQLRQVVLNLVANASEALPDGVGCIRLRTGTTRLDAGDIARATGSAEAEPGEHVFLEVEDTGPGMDPETRAQVFEPFFSTKFTGRGMGLATVLGIARGHRGVVEIASRPGEGTRVRVLLPASRSLAVSPGGMSPEAAPEPAGARLLVVDDDPDVLEIAREFLERAGYAVITAGGGRAGIERFRADPDAVDAVVLDVAMPEVGGSEVFQAIRELRDGIPVVLASGYSEEFTAERFSAAGASGFVRKPYEPEKLLTEVRRALAARPPAG